MPQETPHDLHRTPSFDPQFDLCEMQQEERVTMLHPRIEGVGCIVRGHVLLLGHARRSVPSDCSGRKTGARFESLGLSRWR